MKKEMRFTRLLTGLCIIVAVMGLSIGAVGATTVTQVQINGTCFGPVSGYAIATQGSLSLNGSAITNAEVVAISPVNGQAFVAVSDNATMLTQAAEKLGVTEQALADALNVTTNEPVNLNAAAGQLGVTPQQLMDALGLPALPTKFAINASSGKTGVFVTQAVPADSLFRTGFGSFLSNVTLLTEAAGKLGVPEQTLAQALNATPDSPVNFIGAANQLGVTPQQLMDALGFPTPVTVTSGKTGIFVDISNVTVLTNAAEKLGVSERTLANALNATADKPVDLNAAAQQLGITQQQLADALGLPSPETITKTLSCGTAGSNGVALVVMRSSGQ